MALLLSICVCAGLALWAATNQSAQADNTSACPLTQQVIAEPNAEVANYGAKTSDTNFDLTGLTVTYLKTIGVTVAGSNICVVGPSLVQSDKSRTMQWWKLKQCCSGWGAFKATGNATFINSRADNVAVDMYQFAAGTSYAVKGAYGTYVRDDCIADPQHVALTISDSLFDGCHTGISWRGNLRKPPPFPVTISDSLFYVQPQPGNASGGSCKQWVVNGMANAGMWKMDSYKGSASLVNVSNTVIRIDLLNHECGDLWPAGTYSNVTLVWTGPGSYPAVPAGVTVTTDVSVWDDAKAQWLQAHGYGASPSPSPTDSPSPSPTDSPPT